MSGTPSLSVLDALANALGVSTASLLESEPLPRSTTHVDVHHALAYNLKLGRKWLSWTQEDLAHQSGVARSVIAHIERRGRNPSLDTLVRLASAMDVSPERLLQP